MCDHMNCINELVTCRMHHIMNIVLCDEVCVLINVRVRS
jgi:hypothetical protein